MTQSQHFQVQDDIELEDIICVRCQRAYEAFSEGQAYDCAAEIRGHQVRGSYGSVELDMETATFAAGADHGLADGDLCDACIREMTASGELLRETAD